MQRLFLTSGSLSAFLAVALGAFGAHALKGRLDDYSLGVFQTGVQYQLYHAFGMLVVGLWPVGSALAARAGTAFLVGTVFFSGSLYALAGTGVRAWGAVTPLGGVAFLVGWMSLALAARKLGNSGAMR